MRSRYELAKIPLCLLIAFSTAFGAYFYGVDTHRKAFLLALSVFFLAAGAATLNNIQESSLDSLMSRTKKRALPSGRLEKKGAITQATILLLLGLSALVVISQNAYIVITGVIAVLLYNGVYTPLKTKTELAILPGALCGAIPPYIGWVGAGGSIMNYQVFLIFGLFLFWQVPHFWLVTLRHKADYLTSKQPSLLGKLSETGLHRLLLIWIGGLVVIMHLFAMVPPSIPVAYMVAISANGLLLLLIFLVELRRGLKCRYNFLFIAINTALLLHMLVLSLARMPV